METKPALVTERAFFMPVGFGGQLPVSAPRPCAHPGCRELTQTGRCDAHVKQQRKLFDQSRGKTAERGYGGRWQKARATYLASHPLCVRCQDAGYVEPATVVDHIKPHQGDQDLFWDVGNWQPLCKQCHDRKTAREDGGWGVVKSPRLTAS